MFNTGILTAPVWPPPSLSPTDYCQFFPTTPNYNFLWSRWPHAVLCPLQNRRKRSYKHTFISFDFKVRIGNLWLSFVSYLVSISKYALTGNHILPISSSTIINSGTLTTYFAKCIGSHPTKTDSMSLYLSISSLLMNPLSYLRCVGSLYPCAFTQKNVGIPRLTPSWR